VFDESWFLILQIIKYIFLGINIFFGLKGILDKTFQPQPMSFLVWNISGTFSLIYSFLNNSALSAIILQIVCLVWNTYAGISGLIIILKGQAQYKIHKIDFVLMFFAIVGFVIYLFTKDVFWSAIINMISSLIATAIIWKKIYLAPYTEPFAATTFSGLSLLINCLSMKNINDFLIYGFAGPVSLVTIVELIIRRHQLKGEGKIKTQISS